MSKLTLNETVALALTNHFPLELVPGETERQGENSFRFHCLLNHPSLPELSLVFGDEAHGYLFDSAWFSAVNGKKIRVKEFTARQILESKFHAPRWTREMPDAENPVVLNLEVTNSDLGYIRGRGKVLEIDPEFGVIVATRGDDRTAVFYLDTDQPVEIGSLISFDGVFSYPDNITAVSIH
jgi:hypothetical protein